MTDSVMEGMARPPKYYPPRSPLAARMPRHKRERTVHVYPMATFRYRPPGKIHRHPTIDQRNGPINGTAKAKSW